MCLSGATQTEQANTTEYKKFCFRVQCLSLYGCETSTRLDAVDETRIRAYAQDLREAGRSHKLQMSSPLPGCWTAAKVWLVSFSSHSSPRSRRSTNGTYRPPKATVFVESCWRYGDCIAGSCWAGNKRRTSSQILIVRWSSFFP